MYVTIERFEEEFAIIETEEGHLLNIPRCLTRGAKEGDVLYIGVDHEKTKEKTKEITDLMDKLFKD